MEIILSGIKKDNRKENIKLLKRQFQEARGIESNNISTEELIEWLEERIRISENYLMLLDYMGLEYDHPMTAEIGKSAYDTAVKNKDTTIITPYTYGLDSKGRIIRANFSIIDENKENIILPKIKIDSIMTQNPYSESNIRNWAELFNREYYEVTLGIYGKIYDDDRKKKIAMLERFKNSLTQPYKEERYTLGDEYGYAITSGRVYQKIKAKSK